MYKALEVEFIISKTMLIMINGENKREAKHESVRIKLKGEKTNLISKSLQ